MATASYRVTLAWSFLHRGGEVGRAPGLPCIVAAGCLDRCATRICARAKGYKPPAVFRAARRPRRRAEERA